MSALSELPQNIQVVRFWTLQLNKAMWENDDYLVESDEGDDSLLYEMTSIGRAQLKPKGKKWFMSVHYDPQRRSDPYFMFYDAPTFQRNAPCARIAFREPRYIVRPDNSNKHFNLSSIEKKALVRFMNSPSDDGRYEGLTNWEMSIMLYNREAVQDKLSNLKRSQCTRAFMEANKCMFSRGQLRNFLPIDLPMPDYTQLPEV